MLFCKSFLWKGCRFGGALCHLDSIVSLIIYSRWKPLPRLQTFEYSRHKQSNFTSFQDYCNFKILTILLVLFDKVGGERSIFLYSGLFTWIVGKAHIPRSSAISLGDVGFSCPGRAVDIQQKSSLLNWSEQIFECFDGCQWARLRSTKSTHLFRLLRHSGQLSSKNGILWRPILLSGFAVSLQLYTTHLSGITKLLSHIDMTKAWDSFAFTRVVVLQWRHRKLEPIHSIAQWWDEKGPNFATLSIHR